MSNNAHRRLRAMLSDQHLAQLREESGISDEVILERGYTTIRDPKDLDLYGFPESQRRPGLLLPVHATDGEKPLYVLRPDQPRVKDGKPLKYEMPAGQGMRLDCPPRCRELLGDPRTPLWVTEGQKKADALASHGACAIALLGVWNWKGKNKLGGTTVLADWDHVHLKGRDVRMVFDSDVMTKPQVRAALERLTEHLKRKDARVRVAYLPGGNEHKVGVDDWLVEGHTIAELEALLEPLRSGTQLLTPEVQWHKSPPDAIRRFLTLVGGRGYAATYLYCTIKRYQKQNRDGEVVTLDPPEEVTSRELIVVRDDGTVFGLGGDQPLDELGLDIHLSDVVPSDQLWSTAGVEAYREGRRPDPKDVFERVVRVVEHFLDFGHDMAEPRLMAELVACHIIGTYFLDATNVVGFLWPNGDRGSGKSTLLTVHTEMSYLGTLILASSSFATLRDLAHYGATLAFDDAENVADGHQFDPDKKALLLAGNRRGATVTLNEPQSDGTWRIRRVDAFTNRLFSAIGLPDPVLGSRTIIIPLLPTSDRKKGGRQPQDQAAWPIDRRQLVDDLWALGLANLVEMRGYDQQVPEKAQLTGRDLEPWRTILAVAQWLEDHRVESLHARLEELSRRYQKYRKEREEPTLSHLIVRAMCQCAVCDISQAGREHADARGVLVFSVQDVVANILQTAAEDEIDVTWFSGGPGRAVRVGIALNQLGVAKHGRTPGGGARLRIIPYAKLYDLAKRFQVPEVDSLPPLQHGTPGISAQDGEAKDV